MRAACQAECEALKAEGNEEEEEEQEVQAEQGTEGTEEHTLGEGQAL